MIDPTSVYEVNYLGPFESWQVDVDAYDVFGRSLGRFNLGLQDDPRTDESKTTLTWHKGFLGDPRDPGAMFLQLPSQTFVIEVRYGTATTLSFLGDDLEGGAQVVRWRDSRSLVSNRTVDFVKATRLILYKATRPIRWMPLLSNQVWRKHHA